jgi:hypothetical protein
MRFSQFLTGTSGDASSKRLFTFILVILFAVYFVANLFFHKELKPSIEENLFYLIIVTFAGVTFEKPINSLTKKSTDEKSI